jgi:hypothetical protein
MEGCSKPKPRCDGEIRKRNRQTELQASDGFSSHVGALAVQEILALLRLLDVRYHSRSFPPGKVGTEAAHRGSEILAGIAILVVAPAILQVSSRTAAVTRAFPDLAAV